MVEAGGAVDNADAACFEQLVDMDAILHEAVDLFMKEAAKPENSSLLPPMLALMFSGAALAEDNGLGVRTLLVSEARAFVHNGIASGAFAGKSVQGYEAEGWVAPCSSPCPGAARRSATWAHPCGRARTGSCPLCCATTATATAMPCVRG